MRNSFFFGFVLFIVFISCNGRGNRDIPPNPNDTIDTSVIPVSESSDKLGKAIFYIENSGSMFGYVNGFTEYVDVVSDLVEKPRFAEENTDREFFFVNGGEKIEVTPIGNSSNVLKDKLNTTGFNVGDVTKSNLNAMFQLALSSAKQDTISILITDGIYDLGKPESPMNALATEGKETRTKFIQNINDRDVQTIIVKLSSSFRGYYYPANSNAVSINQNRPYYLFIFGDSELLSSYFSDEYLESLTGYSNLARFLKWSKFSVPYQITNLDRVGTFRFDNKIKNKLNKAKALHNNFQFTYAVNFNEIPFSSDFFLNKNNYEPTLENYTINDIRELKNEIISGIKDFNPTHLVTLKSDGNPFGILNVKLNYSNPDWIDKTSIDDENEIVGDVEHTFGFNFLTKGIAEAYEHMNKTKSIMEFNFEITN